MSSKVVASRNALCGPPSILSTLGIQARVSLAARCMCEQFQIGIFVSSNAVRGMLILGVTVAVVAVMAIIISDKRT